MLIYMKKHMRRQSWLLIGINQNRMSSEKPNEEIEVKFRIEDKRAVQLKLQGLGWKIKELRFQRDTRVKQPTGSMAYTNVFPRIREDSNGSTTLTVKVKRNPDKSEYF